MANVPNLRLINGREMPMLGLGTWNSPRKLVKEAVEEAIDLGYRHFDCAYIYQNEHEVGKALAAKINDGTVKREDLFITSKLWNTFHRPDLVQGALQESLKNLQLDYVDMYLIHWPMGYRENAGLFPTDSSGKISFSSVDFVDTWVEMEKLVEKGMTKSIGLSNFNKNQIERVLDRAKIHPACNQVECHPYLTQKRLSEFCKSQDIVFTAYSPLGSPDRPWPKPSEPVLLEDAIIESLAQKYNKTPAQMLLRFQIQRNHIVIPKSVSKEHIKSNIEIFDFQISAEDMDVLLNLGTVFRYIDVNSDAASHPHFPFDDEF